MSTEKTASPSASSPAASSPPAPKTSPVRLIVLLALLAVAIGALAYDYLVAGPGYEAGQKKIEAYVDARNKLGVKEGSLVTAEDIRKELGMQPSKIEKNDEHGYTVEYYCWWGNVPLLNLRRHYISVVYIGQEPRHFSSFHGNSPPPPEALPIPEAPETADAGTLPMPQAAGEGGAAAGSAEGAATGEQKEGASESKTDPSNEGKSESKSEATSDAKSQSKTESPNN